MGREATVYWIGWAAGSLSEGEEGYVFEYFESWLDDPNARAVSLTLPLRKEPYVSNTMFAFFDGLIPEGWLLEVAAKTWKLDTRDRMGLLLACCRDCIGAVSVRPAGDAER
jgi:serine/threonine-protein kinase HipA